MTEEDVLSNIQNEMLFVGCIYKQSDLLIEVEKNIKSEFYFTDPVTKFFYDNSIIIYKREQSFTEKAINVYMSEDKIRLGLFREYGGIQTIKEFMDLCEVESFNSYYEMLKKYALIREYKIKFQSIIERVLGSKKFQTSTAGDIYRYVRGIIDSVHTNIITQTEIEFITDNMTTLIDGYLESPSMGAITPFESFNELFRGFRTSTSFALGMLSNDGKTRLMVKLAAYNAIIQKNRTMLLLNEMSSEEVKIALLVTILNNREFQNLHGVKIEKPEREISLGLYKDIHGNFIYRLKDGEGNFLETAEEYKNRLLQDSREFREVLKVSSWIEEFGMKNLAVIDIGAAYDDKSLETTVRKNARMGYSYIFYDTMKSDSGEIGDWSSLKKTATMLSEISKQEGIFLYNSVQLTDEAENVQPLDLNSNVIANAKQIRHVLDSLILAKRIEPETYGKYKFYPCDEYLDEFCMGEMPKDGVSLPVSSNPADKLYAFVVSKNRAGEKKKVLVKVNLDFNYWYSLGYIVHAKKSN